MFPAEEVDEEEPPDARFDGSFLFFVFIFPLLVLDFLRVSCGVKGCFTSTRGVGGEEEEQEEEE